MLTTITPYWGREETLKVWMAAVKGASLPNMKHIVFFVGEPIPDAIRLEYGLEPMFQLISCLEDTPGNLSIGHYHNLGARLACTEWMMKMDVDTLPNVRYFKELQIVLRQARQTEWFNGGMFYVSPQASAQLLCKEQMPLREEVYQEIMRDQRRYGEGKILGPSATNFICRTKVYLEMGGCDERFRGYGWEDYQQIYMLERHQRGKDPLPGHVDFQNVHRRCCQEISRVKARTLYARNNWLCLLHRYHPSSKDTAYKSAAVMNRNRQLLLDYVLKMRMANLAGACI